MPPICQNCKKQLFTNYEVKESHGFAESPPGIPRTFPWDTEHIIGITYPEAFPKKRLDAASAYARAMSGAYYLWIRQNKRWDSIGGGGEFVEWVAEGNECEYSWPEQYKNPREFYMGDVYDVLPWREIIRKHIDQKLYVSDRDMVTYRATQYRTR